MVPTHRECVTYFDCGVCSVQLSLLVEEYIAQKRLFSNAQMFILESPALSSNSQSLPSHDCKNLVH